MNISTTNTCLILTVDGQDCLNNVIQKMDRDYEQESLNCVKYWRERAGWLKDIQIFVHSPVNNIRQEIIDGYEKYTNITYIDERVDIPDLNFGFCNVHYSGKWMEDNVPEQFQYFIHIDLDMELLREIPKEFFDVDASVLVGGYNEEDYKFQRRPLYKKDGVPIITNTDLIISDRNFGFYTKVVDMIESFDYTKIDREYDVEEYCSDELASIYDDIQTVIGYEQGEGYSFEENHDNCYFWHEHINSTHGYRLKLHKHKVKKWISKITTTS